MRGTVATFDGPAGFGTVRPAAGDAGHEGDGWFFHCTQLTDGSRTVDVGAEVRFDVVAGHLGRWEAVHVERA